MVFIDEVLEYGAHEIRARRAVRAGDLFVDAGELPDAALIECIAQTIAAGDAQYARSKGGRVRKGYLTGLTGVKFESRARAGETIDIEATCLRRMDGMGLFDASARVGGRVLARGTFKLFVDIDYSK